MADVDLEAQHHRLAAGLARVAVAVHLTDEPAAGLERTLAQQQLLLLLSRGREAYTVTELAADAGLTASATEASLATLVREGLVAVTPAASSPRDPRVALTDQGHAQAPELLHWAADLLSELSNLDETGQRELLFVVTDHIRRLQRQGRIPIVKMCLTCRFFDGYAHPGSAEPHHCRLVDAAFGPQLLRLRCPEQEPASTQW